MITFIICLAALIIAYFTYGRYLQRLVAIDPKNPTPCQRMADGVDYIPLPRWRVFLIQLLNIAGTGPIFGAILGACFGPVAFIWITLGGIFFGGMHDFISGVMLTRDDGRSLPEMLGDLLGNNVRNVLRWFTIALMIMVGAVFLVSPAQLLNTLIDSMSINLWMGIIIVYYLLATILPVDKIIGRFYPVFGAAMLVMAVGLLWVLFTQDYTVPELDFHNYHSKGLPLIPTLFITIACGAISGFHATQSPLMARCIGSEHHCRSVFYGAMITESVIALIWAAIAIAFFHGPAGLNAALAENGNSAAWVVNTITTTTMGRFGAILAILGVVAAPITSGDTAFRSARLIVADMFNIDQRNFVKRFSVCIPIFAVGFFIANIDFDIIWRYFAWSNQALAGFTLWGIYLWLRLRGHNGYLALIPAVIMTYITGSFVFTSSQFLGITNLWISYSAAAVSTAIVTWAVMRYLPHIDCTHLKF